VVWLASGGSDIRVALMTGFTPNQDTQDAWDDVSANEITPSGDYSAGGKALTEIDPAYDSGTNETRLDAADVTWTASTLSATHAVIYAYNATASLAYLLGYVDFGGTVASTAGDYTITWPSDGVLKLTAS
jgi:hypothetical protein